MSMEFNRFSRCSDTTPAIINSSNQPFAAMHHHTEYELFYLDKGTTDMILGGNNISLKTDDIIFITAGTDHFFYNQSQNFHYYSIVFNPFTFGSENDATRKIFNEVIINQEIYLSNQLEEKFEPVFAAQKTNMLSKDLMLKSLIFEIFTFILNTKQYAPLPSFMENDTNKKSISQGLKYIREHYMENISLNDLLNSTNYSKSHFIRLFKSSTGMNYTDYLNRFRVEQACKDLVYSDKNITEVATENGFNNIQYFSKIFKKYMDCTPKQYQKKWKARTKKEAELI
ncbi:MAG: AraC family transcriptional regulator [Treponema sp.]|nr:AraC family transcriptional regulator [Treponema sp.]